MRYDIGELIAKEFLLSKDLKSVDMTGYECDEGKADALCIDESGCHVLLLRRLPRPRKRRAPPQARGRGAQAGLQREAHAPCAHVLPGRPPRGEGRSL